MPLGNPTDLKTETYFSEVPVNTRFWMHPDDEMWLEKTRPQAAPTDTGFSNARRADGLTMWVYPVVVVWVK